MDVPHEMYTGVLLGERCMSQRSGPVVPAGTEWWGHTARANGLVDYGIAKCALAYALA